MARPRSDDKRNAILEAAAEAVAMLGVSAPTAKIAGIAGVAEGTIFTYFENKDELLNELYLSLKADLRTAMMADYPGEKSLIDRSRHVWERYVGWGSANPLKRKAMSQLAVSERITPSSKKLGSEGFAQINDTLRQGVAGGPLKNHPFSFATGIMNAIAETTIEFIAREPDQARKYSKAGFEAYWKAISK